MTIAELLRTLRESGIEVRVNGDRLVVRARKGSLPKEVASTLRSRKAEIISFLSEGSTTVESARSSPEIVRIQDRSRVPASFTQQRLFYLHEVDENPAVHNLPLCLRLTGPLCIETLQRALNELLRRHESLRASYGVDDGMPVMVIAPELSLPLHVVSLGNEEQRVDAELLAQTLESEAAKPFDLSTPPVMRALLVEVGETEHYLLLSMHHISVDGLSLQVIQHDMCILYEAFTHGRPSPLPELPIQFADFAVWQHEWLGGSTPPAQVEYWRNKLKGELPVFDIATDHVRPPVRSARGRKEGRTFPKELVDSLRGLALEGGATLYMAMIAAFSALLYRFSGQEDLIIGTPVATRDRRELEGVVGLIINTVLLRIDLAGEPSFMDLLQRVRRDCVESFQNGDVPFQKIVEELQPARDLSRSPIFQVLVAYQAVSERAMTMADVEVNRVFIGGTVSRMDLSLFVRELDDGMSLSLEYNTDLFEHNTIIQLLERFELFAESIVDSPNQPIGKLPLLSRADKDVLAELNATGRDYSLEATIPDLVEAQANATPDAVAVVVDGDEMTYADLSRRSNQVAKHLQSMGAGRGSLIGICVDRSLEMIVALLGILKSGAAYVPLDPDFPEKRLLYMIEDAELQLVVTQEKFAGLTTQTAAEALCLDTEWKSITQIQVGPLAESPEADDLAYVIYTSGSTGKPKGVEVEHRQVVNFLLSMREEPGCTAQDTLIAVTTLSFDIAVLELLLPLIAGGRVVVADRSVCIDGPKLSRLIQESGATMMQATPATWRLLLEAGWQGSEKMKALCGGEAMPTDLAKDLVACTRELWNMYGPTETTVWSTCARVDDTESKLTIGRPIGNTRIRILDGHLQQVPTGVPGELLIGGRGVTRGYRGRGDLTAEKYVIDPVDPSSRGRFYRTGDQVKLHPDGAIEFIGRIDKQVKVQGFRIELGEIESTLSQLGEVKEAAVVTDGRTGEARLVAYVVYNEGSELTASELRRELRDHLPYYMVPGLVVELDELPLTPNGKIDRKALPDPMRVTASFVEEYTAPATDVEKAIAEVWQEFLNVEQVGANHNFFELGGHSLLSLRVISTLESRLGYHVDPRLMFFQSLGQIAAQVDSGRDGSKAASVA